MGMMTWLSGWIKKRNDRLLRSYQPLIQQIYQEVELLKHLPDEVLKERYQALRVRYQAEHHLESLLPACFALVQEAAARTLGLRHFEVQLLGGIALYQGKIAEMSTGEGKTLVATLPAALQALAGEGVHIITVNEYLAQRDAAWMRPVYEALGLRVSVVLTQQSRLEKQSAYEADITYTTSHEVGFDHLRDQMVYRLSDRVQRRAFAIIDEIDCILIDEARTPLIISGPSEKSAEWYLLMNRLVCHLKEQKEETPGDYTVDWASKQIFLTETGHEHLENLLIKQGALKERSDLYNPAHSYLMHYFMAALRAHTLFKRDVDYVVQEGQIAIVDEQTGRIMSGRRWSEGLHQAIEAKEGVPIQQENRTLASITYQNFFLLYPKLAGMTGTADTEAYEFQQVYGLEVVVIPPNKPCQRTDLGDKIYLTEEEKFLGILEEVKTRHEKGQPILLGTVSIENSEKLSSRLTQAHIPHQVLNAKNHAREADIIAEAGRVGAVTIATNMAGRGTDIVLGGCLKTALKQAKPGEEAAIQENWAIQHAQVIALGGLHVLGTERLFRRTDNQLRGRAGRQGDPGSSQFYLSLEDPLMRRQQHQKATQWMRTLGVQYGEAITHPWITSLIASEQRKWEGMSFDQRKQLLAFDNVANDQRRVIYHMRDQWLSEPEMGVLAKEMLEKVLEHLHELYMPSDSMPEQWDIEGYERELTHTFTCTLPLKTWLKEDLSLSSEQVAQRVTQQVQEQFENKIQSWPEEMCDEIQRSMALHYLDMHWREYLANIEYLRQNMHLRGYAQKDPKQEFKREAFVLFEEMLKTIEKDWISALFYIRTEEIQERIEQTESADRQTLEKLDIAHQKAPQSRNAVCACGSGRKYKHCHGKI